MDYGHKTGDGVGRVEFGPSCEDRRDDFRDRFMAYRQVLAIERIAYFCDWIYYMALFYVIFYLASQIVTRFFGEQKP